MTEDLDPAQLLAHAPLIASLDEDHRQIVLELANYVRIPARDTIIVREGDDAENFYVILQGEADVLKLDPTTGREYPISMLGAGAHFGEAALFREVKRTATIRSRSPMVLAMIRTREIRESPDSHPWLANFLLALVRHDATRIDRLTNQTMVGLRAWEEGSERLITLAKLSSWAIGCLAIYALALGCARLITNTLVAERLVDVVYLGVCASLVWLMVDSRVPLRSYGVRLPQNLARELGETLAVTGACALLVTGLKWLLIHTVDAYSGLSLLSFSSFPLPEVSLLYALLLPLQELCARGILQTALEQVFEDDPRRVILSIVLSNALFAALHVHLSPYYAVMGLMMFVPGLMWGVLYARHRSLLGVSISHVLLGIWTLRVLGVEVLFQP